MDTSEKTRLPSAHQTHVDEQLSSTKDMDNTTHANHENIADLLVTVDDGAQVKEMDDDNIGTNSNSITVLPPPFSRKLPNEIVFMILNNELGQNTLYECSLVNAQFHIIANFVLWDSPVLTKNANSEIFMANLMATAAANSNRHLTRLISTLTLEGSFWHDSDLALLIPQLPHLEELVIFGHTHLSHYSLQYVPSFCRRLQVLDLTGVLLDQHWFDTVGRYARRLCQLALYSCHHPTPHAFEPLVPLISTTTPGGGDGCPALQTLRVWYDSTMVRSLMTNLTMTSVKKFNALTTLEIDGPPGSAIKHLLKLPPTNVVPWPYLNELVLNPCHYVRDSLLIQFITSHPHLTKLSLLTAFRLTNISIDAIARCLRKLTSLQLRGCPSLTSDALRRLVQQCPELVSIEIQFCRKISPTDFPGSIYTDDDYLETGLVILEQDALDWIRQQW